MPASRALQAQVAERRAKVLAMRLEQVPYSEIAALLDITVVTAKVDYIRAIEQRKEELDEQRHLTVAAELARLEVAERAAWQVLRTRHILSQQGRIVRDENDVPLTDDAPTLAAIDRILKIAERRSRLLGLDAPVRAKVEVTDAVDADIERLVAELAGLASGGEAAAPGAPGPGSEQAPAS